MKLLTFIYFSFASNYIKMNYELIFVQYAWYIWTISFSFLSATIEMNS